MAKQYATVSELLADTLEVDQSRLCDLDIELRATAEAEKRVKQ